MQKLMNFIGGDFKAPTTGSWFDRECPITGDIHAAVPDSDLLDLVQAVQAANKAGSLWFKEEPEKRYEFLSAIADRIEAEASGLALIQCEDTGIALEFSRELIDRAAEIFRYHARPVEGVPCEGVPCEGVPCEGATAEGAPASRFHTGRLPIGLVGVITPWSEAFFQLASRVAPALSAGNVIIAKPSELAPRTADAFARIVHASGLPAGVFNLVQGRGVRVGAQLLGHPGISTIAFTGSTPTGRVVLSAAAEGFKRTHLALGARNPVLVFAGSGIEEDPKKIALLASLCLGGRVRTCMRGSRVFVQETIYQRFFEVFKAAVESMVIGDPRDAKTDLGPLISAPVAKRFAEAAAQAFGENGKSVLAKFEDSAPVAQDLPGGHFVRPVVVRDLTLCSTLQQEEVLGPFITVSSFKYQHEAVKHANNSPLGQAAYVFHGDAEKALKIATKLEASRVFVNSGERFDPAAVYSGVKGSGFGREGGAELVRFFSRESLIATP